MKRQEFRRRVLRDAPVSGLHTIKSIKVAAFEDGQRPRTVPVDTLYEYESGCKVHRDCYGHLCSVNGVTLPPHSMSMRSGDIATEYNKAAKLVFSGNTTGYVEAVQKTNFTKHGTMRSTMSTPIAGSGRLIATPQWQFGPSCLAISQNLASKIKVCRWVITSSGSECSTYVEGSLREGDWVIAVRPPSFHFGNTQPMQIKYWSRDCVGIHPESFSAFHGDFDGDEVQFYPVSNPESIKECESWEQLPLPAFVKGREVYNAYVDTLESNPYRLEKCEVGEAEFIRYTTLSSKQIADGPPELAFGEYSRNKSKHISGMSSRFNTRETELSFVRESIRGMGDVARQQLSQGYLGDMTRVAKIAASCFYRPASGGLHVITRNGSRVLSNDGICDSGAPSIRAIANLCAVAQQAALDSHRAESHDVVSHDFIGDLMHGTDRKSTTATGEMTLVEVTTAEIDVGFERWYNWKYVSNSSTFYLCKPEKLPIPLRRSIVGAYNPIVLRYVSNIGGNVQAVCRRGITTVCNYYGVRMSEVELNDASYVFSYDVKASIHPITCREGMLMRSLGWVETMLATDHTKLKDLVGCSSSALTTSSAMLMSNFEDLVTRHD